MARADSTRHQALPFEARMLGQAPATRGLLMRKPALPMAMLEHDKLLAASHLREF